MLNQAILRRAYLKLRASGTASGSDGMDIETFEADLDNQLELLLTEIFMGMYKPKPVKAAVLMTHEKERQIHLFSIRDKLVQIALAEVLNDWYADRVPKGVYGFVKGKGVQSALKAFESWLDKYPVLCKTDIQDFFDSLQHSVVESVLKQFDFDQAFISLVIASLKYEYFHEGVIQTKTVGIAQGSHLSPVLSNIVLMGLDHAIGEGGSPYIRYVDDLILLGESQAQLEMKLKQVDIQLRLRGLQLNQEKTGIFSSSDPFSYLGFEYRQGERTIPVKAFRLLESKIQAIHNHPFMEQRDKHMKIKRISDGWKQFYQIPTNRQLPQKSLESSINPYEIFLKWISGFGLDPTAYQYIDLKQDEGYQNIQTLSEGLTVEWIQKQLNGEVALLASFDKEKEDAIGAVIDIDLSKGVLMNPAYDHVKDELMTELKHRVTTVISKLNQLEVYPLVEFSGRRGYHLWILFEKVENAAEVMNFCSELALVYKTDNIKIDIFPDPVRNRQTIKLPLSRHPKTKGWSVFVNEHLEEISLQTALESFRRSKGRSLNKPGEEVRYERLDIEFVSKQFGSEASQLIEKCSILRYLVEKAFETHYLDHSERLTLALIFLQLSSGRHLVHYIMKQTFNYKRSITEKLLNEIPNKPIGCIKMKERHQQVNLSFDCSCQLAMTRFSYDTPLNHLPASMKGIDPEQLKQEMDQLYQLYLSLRAERKAIEKRLMKAENEIFKKMTQYSKENRINCSTGSIRRIEQDEQFIFALFPY